MDHARRFAVFLFLVAELLALDPGRARPAEVSAGIEQAGLTRIAHPPLGLPAVPFPADNPPTAEKIALGRKLFFDERLSGDGKLSCGLCHLPEHGFAVNGNATAVGKGGMVLRRNAPTVLNVTYQRAVFRDGRVDSIEKQALAPFVAADEMANPSMFALIEKIRGLKDYGGMFERAFGTGPTPVGIAYSIASFERTLLAADSPFDRWRFGKQEQAVSSEVKRGFELFTGKAICSACHLIGESEALFTDHRFRDVGIGWKRSRMGRSGRGIMTARDGAEDERLKDFGRFEVTHDPVDMFLYLTPSLRNAALTAPYMHDGSMATLEEVVDYYNRGGFNGYGIDPLIHALSLDADEKRALVAFLKSLTSDGIAGLIAESRQP